jgi:hypothetical protein
MTSVRARLQSGRNDRCKDNSLLPQAGAQLSSVDAEDLCFLMESEAP